MRLLLIGSEPGPQRVMPDAELAAGGHELIRVPGLAEAELALERGRFEGILLVVPAPTPEKMEWVEKLRNSAPGADVMVLAGQHLPGVAAEALRRGAADFLSMPLAPEQLLSAVARADRLRKLEARVDVLEGRGRLDLIPPAFDTQVPALQAAYRLAWQAASMPAPILIAGEHGTGKSILARAIHAHSPQSGGRMLTLECWGLPPEAAAAELFGDPDGVQPVVTARPGKVAAASGGTLYLHEIGALSMEIQRAVLILLERREYQRTGETRSRRAAVHLVASTSQDLRTAVASGHFRQDLLQRLESFVIRLPPLRDRAADLDELAAYFLQFYSRQIGKHLGGIDPTACAALRGYAWPGNLRELGNVMERAALRASGNEVELRDLPAEFSSRERAEGLAGVQVGARLPLAEIEKEHIRRVMDSSQTFEEAAQVLAIDPATLYRKRKLWGL